MMRRVMPKGFSDLRWSQAQERSGGSRAHSQRVLELGHAFRLPSDLKGKMAERSKACDSSEWV